MRCAARPDRPFLSAAQRIHQLTFDTPASVELLQGGEIELLGQLTDASNATFLCRIGDGDEARQAVYKPVRGERALDDFPRGTLANREVAAFALSEVTGWCVVPPSVLRDGPLGPGMVQQWVEIDAQADVLAMIVERDERLRRVSVFDIIANNADRKGGHLLPTVDGHVYGVDHGICFAVAPKLRTVLWGWRGERLLDGELAVVERICESLERELGSVLGELLSAAEVRATQRRAAALVESGRFPQPDPGRPALPWPPF